MIPDEFKSFEKEKSNKKKWIIVTNNIRATNSYGEMSHVWLTMFWADGTSDGEGIVTFDETDRKIIGLTHWKYA